MKRMKGKKNRLLFTGILTTAMSLGLVLQGSMLQEIVSSRIIPDGVVSEVFHSFQK